MDEQEYRSAYQNVNPIRCVFEKAINSRQCNCSQATRFNLADREGVSCDSQHAQSICSELLSQLRQKGRFALQLALEQEQLPHNAEIKIQNGGVRGILKQIDVPQLNENDIYGVIQAALGEFKTIGEFPFSEIVREVSAYQPRKRRQRNK